MPGLCWAGSAPAAPGGDGSAGRGEEGHKDKISPRLFTFQYAAF